MTDFQKKVYPVRKLKKVSSLAEGGISKFSNEVYQIVKKIPRGKVLSYQEVAIRLGNSALARAVGGALNRNFNKRVPCHRVIRANGEIGGYRSGVKKKIEILKKEGVRIKNERIVYD